MRTTVVIPDDLRERAKQVAAQRGVSMGRLVREALEKELAAHQPWPRSIGIGASKYSDTSEKAGDIPPEPRSWR